jgi:hypothetical protein
MQVKGRIKHLLRSPNHTKLYTSQKLTREREIDISRMRIKENGGEELLPSEHNSSTNPV